ncbi:MAG: hypothetical protein ACK5XH_10695, partial [Lysobacteraceae bacterium]
MFLTEDGGETWTHVLVPSNDWTGASDLVIDPSRPDVLYAALWDRQRAPWQFTEAGDGSGIHKSTDGGRTWRRLDGGLPQGDTVGRIGLAVARSRPDTVYATIDHWAPLPEALQDLGDRPLSPQRLKAMSREEFLAQDPAEIEGFIRGADLPVELDAKTLLDGVRDGSITLPMLISRLEDGNAALFDNPTWGHTVWRTDDGGSTWRRTHDTPIREVTYSYGYYFAEVAVDPSDAERVYTMGVPLIVSSDGGKTWEGYTNHPSVHVDHHSLWIDPNHPQRLLLGNDGGLDVSHDRGVTWRKLDAQPVGQFYTIYADMAEPYNVYGGLQDNGSWRGPATVWENGGIRNAHWQEVCFGDGFATVPDPQDSRQGYAMSQGGYLVRYDLRTGGQKLIRPPAPDDVELRFPWNAAIALDPFAPGTLFYGSQFVHKSTDRGESWQIVSPDLTPNDPEKQKQHE